MDQAPEVAITPEYGRASLNSSKSMYCPVSIVYTTAKLHFFSFMYFNVSEAVADAS
jgi:hypothetical protein